MGDPEVDDGLRRWWGPAALALVVLAAVLLRLPALTAGLPYTTYVDEFAVLDGSVHQIDEGTWDPGVYNYPTQLMTLTTASGAVVAAATGADLSEGARTSQEATQLYVFEPRELVLGGRLVVLVMSGLLVVWVGLLGRAVRGWPTGLVAAALAAVLPALVSKGAVIITDTVATAFTALVLLAAVHLGRDPARRRWALAAGAGLGLAVTAKYTAGAVVLVPLGALLARRDVGRRVRLEAAGLVALAGAVAAVVAMPALVLDPGAVREGIDSVRTIYAGFPPSASLWEAVRSTDEVGSVFGLVAAAGLAALLLRPATRWMAASWGLVAVVTVAVAASSAYQPFRNVMPVLPMACVAAAAAVDEVAGAAGRLLRRPRLVPALALALGALVCLPMLTGPDRRFWADQRHLVDTRVEARRWMEDHVEPGDRVLVAEELAFLPSELDRLDAEVEVRPQAGFDVAGEWDVVVAGEVGDRPYAWAELLAGRPVEHEVGTVRASCGARGAGRRDDERCPASPFPRSWHRNEVLVRIYGAPADEG